MTRRLGLVLTLVALTLPAVAVENEPLALATYTVRTSDATITFDPRPIETGVPSEVFVSRGAEPTMLVDKLERALLIGDEKGVLRSTNGGATWTRMTVPYIPTHHPSIGGIYDGWALAQDDAGKIYASTTDGPIINVATSIDGGATWQLGASAYVAVASGLADRPWLAARNNGQVAVTWNDMGLNQLCAYSTDGALTFTGRSVPFLGNVQPIGGPPAFDSAGRLVFAGNGGIGGAAETFYRFNSNPCSTSVSRVNLPPGGAQLSTATVTDGAGYSYLARPSANNNAMQILALSGPSLAGSKSLAVSPSALVSNTFGTIAIRPGELAVSWYGTTTPGNFQDPNFIGAWNVYTARVKDFWTATPSVTVTQVTTTPNHVGDFCMVGTNCDVQTSNPGDRDLLDYFQTAYDAAGNLHIAYGHDGATTIAEVRYSMLPALT